MHLHVRTEVLEKPLLCFVKECQDVCVRSSTKINHRFCAELSVDSWLARRGRVWA